MLFPKVLFFTGVAISLYRISICKNKTATGLSHERVLLDELFESYNKYARPLKSTNSWIRVDIGMAILALTAVDQRNQLIQVHAWFELSWTDEFLTWLPKDYYMTDTIIVDPSMVWKPDIGIYNSIQGYSVIVEGSTKVQISHNGSAVWYPEGTYDILCEISVAKYPFDTQVCDIEVSQWLTDHRLQQMQNIESTIDLTLYRRNTEWEMESTSVTCKNDIGYTDQTCYFTMVLKRRSGHYVLHLLVPVLLLSILTLFSFFVPSSSGEKVSFIVALFLAFTIFIGPLRDNLPVTSLEVCYFAVFIQFQFCFSGLQAALTVLTVAMCRKRTPVPSMLKRLASFWSKRNRISSSGNDLKVIPGETFKKSSFQVQDGIYGQSVRRDASWSAVSDALSKSFFCLFLTVDIIAIAVFLCQILL